MRCSASAAAYMLIGVMISTGIWSFFMPMSTGSSYSSETTTGNVSPQRASEAFTNPREEIATNSNSERASLGVRDPRKEIVETARSIRQQHDLRTVPLGIGKVEGSALLALLKLTKPKVIVESGVYLGGSTRMFAEHFDGDIISIDNNGYGGFQKTIDSFANYTNVKFRIGDGKVIVPNTIKTLKVPFAVFIDGPKCLLALPTIKGALAKGAQFVAMHDACGCVQAHPEALKATLLIDNKDENMTRVLSPKSVINDCYTQGVAGRGGGAGGGTAVWMKLDKISAARFQ